MYTLEGRVALVTGAARGLGAGISRALAADGATVILADVLDAGDTAAEIGADTGADTWATTLDIRDRDAATSLLEQIVSRHGHLDILVNNAGVFHNFAALPDIPDEDVTRVIDINLRGTAVMSAAAIPFISKGTGRIINMASQYGVEGRPGYAIYCATKAGVIGLTQSLALELASEGITVNAVCPGTHLTDMLEERFRLEAENKGLPPEAASALIDEFAAATIPVGRIGTAADVGSIVSWIASDAASFSTGASFNVAGGETLF